VCTEQKNADVLWLSIRRRLVVFPVLILAVALPNHHVVQADRLVAADRILSPTLLAVAATNVNAAL